MSKINVIYWSQSGNTQRMAEAIGEGIVNAGKEANVIEVSQASIEELKEAKVFALGCPAMGDEVLEEEEMEPFVEAITEFASGKHIALFGSYGWGDGQWMRDWVERMKQSGAVLIGEEGTMCQEDEIDDSMDGFMALGKELATM